MRLHTKRRFEKEQNERKTVKTTSAWPQGFSVITEDEYREPQLAGGLTYMASLSTLVDGLPLSPPIYHSGPQRSNVRVLVTS